MPIFFVKFLILFRGKRFGLKKIGLLSMIALALLNGCKQKNMIETAHDGRSLLWEVTGNGLKQPSYFIGTMHLMCAEDAVLSVNTKHIIKEVEQVYLEVDLDNMGELLSGVVSITMAEGNSLSQLLPEDDYEKVKTFFEQHQPHYPFFVLEQQQPMMLSSSLYELFLPCENKNGIDVRIVEEANKLNKETKGLETVAFQASLMDSIPYKEQAQELVKTIDSLDRYATYLKEVVALYQTQDIEKLHSITTKEEAGISAYADLLLYKRNKNWVQQFATIAKEKATLFAVGAGHLGGQEGVINLLKQAGYTVRPLQNDLREK